MQIKFMIYKFIIEECYIKVSLEHGTRFEKHSGDTMHSIASS